MTKASHNTGLERKSIEAEEEAVLVAAAPFKCHSFRGANIPTLSPFHWSASTLQARTHSLTPADERELFLQVVRNH